MFWAIAYPIVIPGRRIAASPESIFRRSVFMDSGSSPPGYPGMTSVAIETRCLDRGIETSAHRLLAIDQPRRAELIRQHAEPDGPERLGDRHRHRPVLRQCMKDPFRFRRAVDAERHH